MVIASSYLKTTNRSLLNVQSPIFFKVPTCALFTALLIILFFSNRHQVPPNFYEFCNSQGDPALQEDGKSTVRLGRKMSPSTFRTLLSEACRALCCGFTIPFVHFTAVIYFLFLTDCSLPLSLPFLLSCLYSFPVFIFLSLLLLKLLMSFSTHSPPLIFQFLFLLYFWRQIT